MLSDGVGMGALDGGVVWQGEEGTLTLLAWYGQELYQGRDHQGKRKALGRGEGEKG